MAFAGNKSLRSESRDGPWQGTSSATRDRQKCDEHHVYGVGPTGVGEIALSRYAILLASYRQAPPGTRLDLWQHKSVTVGAAHRGLSERRIHENQISRAATQP